MRFYLGTCEPAWLPRMDVPLFVSHRRLRRLKRGYMPARTTWALDSGAFTEVATLGRFETTPAEYVRAIARYAADIGSLEWAAPQDHMCEPWVLARSELANTVNAAQRWSVHNLLELRGHDPAVPIIPVLQGQTLEDYLHHAELYTDAGIDLEAEPLVGLGSVCRRQATREIAELVAQLSIRYRLHGFGIKTDGLALYGWMLASSDSMAWSYNGRRIKPCPRRAVGSCAHCRHHALDWRARVLERTENRGHVQMQLTP